MGGGVEVWQVIRLWEVEQRCLIQSDGGQAEMLEDALHPKRRMRQGEKSMCATAHMSRRVPKTGIVGRGVSVGRVAPAGVDWSLPANAWSGGMSQPALSSLLQPCEKIDR
jgi:hypothetical protein